MDTEVKTMTQLEKYIVIKKEWETECETCGVPLLIGDTIITDWDSGGAYCSGTCYKKDQPVLDPMIAYQDLT